MMYDDIVLEYNLVVVVVVVVEEDGVAKISRGLCVFVIVVVLLVVFNRVTVVTPFKNNVTLALVVVLLVSVTNLVLGIYNCSDNYGAGVSSVNEWLTEG